MADLSKETLESLTDVVKSSGSFSSSGGLQPWSYASGSKSESGSLPSRSEYGDNQSELSDFKANVKKLSRKGRRGTDEVMLGTSVFPSSETSVLGNFWGRIKGANTVSHFKMERKTSFETL